MKSYMAKGGALIINDDNGRAWELERTTCSTGPMSRHEYIVTTLIEKDGEQVNEMMFRFPRNMDVELVGELLNGAAID